MQSLRSVSVLCVVAALALLRQPLGASQGGIVPGHMAPRFVLAKPAGGELNSRSFLGRPLVINVFAAWCNNCRVEQPFLSAAYAKYRDDVAFLGVDEQEGVARATAFAKELHVPYPIAVDDGQFAATYDTSKIPETVFIDARGVVHAIYRRVLSAAELDRELTKLLRRRQKA